MSMKSTETGVSRRPIQAGSRLLPAAISGLLAAAVGGCAEDSSDGEHAHEELSNEELAALCGEMVDEAVDEAVDELRDTQASESADGEPDEASCSAPEPDASSCDAEALCADEVKDARAECDAPDVAMVCSEVVQAAEDKCKPLTATTEEKTLSSEQKEYTFAELTKRCDDSGGYVEIHAACGGSNSCQGFSFGDWGPDGAVLTEHSCAGANGCNGLSCLILPKDEGRTGKEIYELEYTEPGPGACTNCHAEHSEAGDIDASKFKVWVQAGSPRTVDNWLDRPAAEQERVVAFGAQGILPNGLAYKNMAAYHPRLSRAEIERVVAHLRTLTPEIKLTKTADAAPATPPTP